MIINLKSMQLSKGFTIIEVIIAIFILSTAVVGIYSAFSMVTILTASTASNLSATYLAQEGIEIIRNIRDTNWLEMDNPPEGASPAWNDGLTSCGLSSGGCEADYTTPGSGSSLLAAYSGSFLYEDLESHFYNNKEGTPTKFKRKIIINCLPSNDCDDRANYIMKVIVQVSWAEKATILNGAASVDDCNPAGGPHNCIVAEETLYDWYNYDPAVLPSPPS